MYQIEFEPFALIELEDSVLWYKKRSNIVADKFVLEIQRILKILKKSPLQFPVKYNQHREIIVSKFPFSIVFVILEKEQRILITSIFHHKRNPLKKFKK